MKREDLEDLSGYLWGEYRAGRSPVPARLLTALTEALEEQPRLNPVCPVCGEDEPLLGFLRGWKGETTYELRCRCRRCGWDWIIEPLSKPWESEG